MMTASISKKASVEALIYAARTGIDPKKIAKILEMKLNQIMILIEEIEKDYSSSDHGVNLKLVNGKYRFYTKKEAQEYVNQISKRPIVRITDSQMEVLAIIALRGPVTKNSVELIRGRSAQYQIPELYKMGLLGKRKSKLPGRPYLYKVTRKFYDLFQLNDMSEIMEGLELKGEVEKEDETSEISSITEGLEVKGEIAKDNETSEISSVEHGNVEEESGGSHKGSED